MIQSATNKVSPEQEGGHHFAFLERPKGINEAIRKFMIEDKIETPKRF